MLFLYEACNGDGKVVGGRIDAADLRQAARQLRARGMTPLNIYPQATTGVSGDEKSKRATHEEKAVAIRELATMLDAGVPLAEAVESIAESHAESGIGWIFYQFHRALRAGESLGAAMGQSGGDWPAFLYPLVSAGELTGRLGAALSSAATQMEYDEATRQEIRNAMTYPIVLIASGVAATLLIFIVVVPKFAGLLKNSHADVPVISQWVIASGLFVRDHLLGVGLLFAGIIGFSALAFRRPQVRESARELLLKSPLLGNWLWEAEISKWSALLATLFENRVPVLSALELAERTIGIDSVRARLSQASREVRTGKKLAEALSESGCLTPMGLNLIRVGEKSGELAPMLRALAKLYETKRKNRTKRFLALLEPLAILVIGGFIGFIMVAIMLAITSMNTAAI